MAYEQKSTEGYNQLVQKDKPLISSTSMNNTQEHKYNAMLLDVSKQQSRRRWKAKMSGSPYSDDQLQSSQTNVGRCNGKVSVKARDEPFMRSPKSRSSSLGRS